MSLPRRAYVETYGCQMNISDGELMEGILESQGYRIADRPEDADVILVNTCAIREHAEQRVLGRVGQLKALKVDRPGLVLGVTGCMAQRMGDDLARKAPWVDLVMGPDGYRSLPEALERVRRGGEGTVGTIPEPAPGARARKRGPQLTVLDFDPFENYEGVMPRRTTGVSAWVPVQRGCNYRCTYCIVPYVRGDEKNRAPAEILAEVIGMGMSADAHHITAPPENGEGAALAMRRALRSAGIEPEEVDYINAHGTSTPLGDVAETRAIRSVFGDHADRLMVSSTKSMLGHALGATSAIEAGLTVFALKHGIVPPTINLTDPDPECDLDYVPLEARRAPIRTALSNSFGFGGANTALVLRRWDGE